MKKLLTITAAISLILATAGGAWAEGQHTGWSDKDGQGNLENTNSNNTSNYGTTSVEGPKGQIENQQNYDCHNCSQDLPGKNR